MTSVQATCILVLLLLAADRVSVLHKGHLKKCIQTLEQTTRGIERRGEVTSRFSFEERAFSLDFFVNSSLDSAGLW